MESVLVDTGVWFAMFDAKDERYKEGQAKAELLEMLRVVIPWPTTYETLRSRFVKNAYARGQFERYLKSPSIVFLDDAAYRDAALELAFSYSLRESTPQHVRLPDPTIDR